MFDAEMPEWFSCWHVRFYIIVIHCEYPYSALANACLSKARQIANRNSKKNQDLCKRSGFTEDFRFNHILCSLFDSFLSFLFVKLQIQMKYIFQYMST